MNINLLAGSAMGMFAGMLVIMIVVTLLFGFIFYIVFKQTKISPEATNVFNVKKMLSRRITQLTIELVDNKNDEGKKTELINRLRRVKSAEALVDELIEEERAISGLGDEEEDKRKRRNGGDGKGCAVPAQRSAGGPAGAKRVVRPVGAPAAKAPVKQEKKPEPELKSEQENKPEQEQKSEPKPEQAKRPEPKAKSEKKKEEAEAAPSEE